VRLEVDCVLLCSSSCTSAAARYNSSNRGMRRQQGVSGVQHNNGGTNRLDGRCSMGGSIQCRDSCLWQAFDCSEHDAGSTLTLKCPPLLAAGVTYDLQAATYSGKWYSCTPSGTHPWPTLLPAGLSALYSIHSCITHPSCRVWVW
jgi:hypothetical protein